MTSDQPDHDALDDHEAETEQIEQAGDGASSADRASPTTAATSARKKSIAIAAVGVIGLAAVGGGALWLSKSDSKADELAFRAQNVYEVVYKFPEGTEVGSDELTVGPDQVREAQAQSPSDVSAVMPAQCDGWTKFDTSRLLGSTVNTVTGYYKGVSYGVNAQVIPQENGPRKQRPSECERISIEYTDGGYTLMSPAETPKIDGVTVEGHRSVLRTAQRQTVDNFSFLAWIDDHHVVVVTAASDPAYKPQANPIDPTLAKELLVEAVRLARASELPPE